MFHRSSSKPSNYRRPGARSRYDVCGLHDGIRQETKRRQRNQRLLILSCKLLLIFGALAGSVYGVREGLNHFFWENPEYNLSVIDIRNDGASLTREMIVEATGLKVGTNVFEINLAEARQAIARLPEVREVDLRRVLPNKITIAMSERRPIAWLAEKGVPDPTTADSSWLVDPSGVVFKPRRLVREFLSLPVINGLLPREEIAPGQTLEAPELSAAIELVLLNGEFNRFQFLAMDVSKGYCIEVTDAQYARLTFGMEGLDQQFKRLNALYDYLNANRQEIQTVNLMVERNMPVVLGKPEPPAEAIPEEGPDRDESEGLLVSVDPATAEPVEASVTPPAPAPSPQAVTKAVAAAPSPTPTRAKRSSRRPVVATIVRKAQPTTPTRRATPVTRSKREAAPRQTIRKAEPVIRRAVPLQPFTPVASR